MKLLGVLYRHLRRKWYKAFRNDYIRQSISKRKGKCKKCGCCNKRLIKCDYMEGKVCTLWRNKGFDALPLDCQNYPFDEKDKSPFGKKHYGFWWDSERRKEC